MREEIVKLGVKIGKYKVREEKSELEGKQGRISQEESKGIKLRSVNLR